MPIKITILFLLGSFVAGCGTETATPQQNHQLQVGYQALNQGQPDLAIRRADEYLSQQPTGPGAAEALYLKGRAYETRPAAGPIQARQNFSSARTAYEDALNQQPARKTEGFIRSALANVAFFQDDYHTALEQAAKAYDLVDSADVQSVLLFRIAVSQQRLGLFTDADHSFDLIQMRFPTSRYAEQARQQQGIRNFYIQLATFNTAAGAERALESLKTTGLNLSTRPDSAGHTLLNAGPFASYDAANDTRQKLAAQFPQALIVP